MVGGEPEPCPVFRPSAEEFSLPFCDYVKNVLKKNKDVAMFKVVPPDGWTPRATPFPDLDSVVISCPIRQHVFGKQGAYRCYLVEHKKLTAAEYEDICCKEDAYTAPKDRRDDEYRERAFWSSVTIRPPLYAADTPQSFFDENVKYGWNLRNLGDLLKQYPVPDIPGVTFPMTYFGMWKAFFAWHVEDADLFSINYMHFGAGKVWYCVSPAERDKFDQMAQSIFPDLHRDCKAFMRHKDILLSPHVLRSYNIKYMQAKQQPGEFIVLNAGAYHSGFNLGFNCAEAVNFAVEEWLPLGEAASRCTCQALKDAVRISMDMFKHPPPSSVSSEGCSEEDEPPKLEEVDTPVQPDRKKSLSPRQSGKGGSSGKAQSIRKRNAPRRPSVVGKKREKGGDGGGGTPAKKQKGAKKKTKAGGVGKTPAAKSAAKSTDSGVKNRGRVGAKGKASRSGRRKYGEGNKDLEGDRDDHSDSALDSEPPESEHGALVKTFSRQELAKPMALVGVDKLRNKRYFYLIELATTQPKADGTIVVRWLKEGIDGLFRSEPMQWEEHVNSLVKVRTRWVVPQGNRRPGYKLLTLRKRILETELVM